MKRLIFCGGAAMTCVLSASAQFSAWLPDAHQIIVTPSYAYQTFDEFWLGRDKMDLSDDVNQHTTLLTLEYGITERLAADATVGYTWVDSTDAFGSGDEDDGLTDTTFGLRYKLLDQDSEGWPMWPNIAVRVGGIIEGSYDENLPFSAGDGASGAEASLLLSRAICPNFGLFGDVGYRYRDGDVPDDLFGSAGAYVAFYGFTLSGAYRHVQGLDGDDIGDPGFSFPEVKEVNQNVEVGLAYRDGGGRYYQLFYAHTVDGRNTGEKDIFGVSASFSFGH